MTRDSRRALALVLFAGLLAIPIGVGVGEVVREYRATAAKVYAKYHVAVALDSLPDWARKADR